MSKYLKPLIDPFYAGNQEIGYTASVDPEEMPHAVSHQYKYVSTIGMEISEGTGPEVKKLFFRSTEHKFQLLIEAKILTNKGVSCFKSLRCCIYHAKS